ncbi:amino acid adenylation domain-containing protein [Streptomonospora nanhaiensis]|uniref:amino acid adenylation domain-containing protein n=1 Tax=Streptomonospora nanhaiensis TaxID=1323731 RepID=UPI001C3921AE|nr:amino acid adenylation domain-containing protein [Streptomonospora nanhaiensis]MBV2363327.1 amino acid adenylation domain-containing protein [Streptomonospora nanhaiensis]MBX9388532.1 amino acid adenylation domain-containing protein [Streptomonospora nanhaiensis]
MSGAGSRPGEAVEATEAALAAHRALNGAADDPYPERGVAELFEAQAARRPRATALVHHGRRMSYAELDERADALAAALRAAGAAPGEAVTVVLPRCPDLVVALLAILKCGAVYLPVDTAWPDERLRTLLDAAASRLVVAREADTAALGARLPGRRVLAVESARPDDGAAPAPVYRAGPDDLAYINFTSGSTGLPKGVPVRHRGIVRLVHGARYARLDEHAVLLQMAPVTFDAATFEIWGALLNGGTLVLYPSPFIRLGELRQVLAEHGVTVLFLTTALFNAVVDEAPDTLAVLRTVLTGGEAHSLPHMAQALRHYGTDRIVSVYGPTECTTFATYHPVRELHPEEPSLPIGRPIQHTRAYLVEDGRLCEPGESGEVLLAGPGLSPGYLGLPDVNARQFADLVIGGQRERVYRTGDRALLSPRGHLVFQGRTDDQVKVNGFRIELGEIAHHLQTQPEVRRCYVTTRPSGQGGLELVGFVVPAAEGCDIAAVRARLRAVLPAYMVPAVIRVRDDLPLTITGKVDRAALLASLEEPSGPDSPAPGGSASARSASGAAT